MRKTSLGFAAISAIAIALPFSASAADLPLKAPPPPVYYSWAGCYFGGNVGGKWARVDGSDTISSTPVPAAGGTFNFGDHPSTAIGGGQLGCNWQNGHFVYGLEGDIDGQNWHNLGTAAAPTPGFFIPGDNFGVRSQWEASARARIGYAFDRTLLYVTGGAAWTRVSLDGNFIATTVGGVTFPATVTSDSRVFSGATFGGGFEYAIWRNVSIGVESRYSWYGTHTFNTGPLAATATTVGGVTTFTTAATSSSVRVSTAEVMAKLNWHFNWWGGGSGHY